MLIEFNIKNQKLEVATDNFLANKSNNYLELHFNFKSNDWDDKVKFCLLRNCENKTYQFNIDSTGIVIVPFTIVKGSEFYISVYGGNPDTTRITTNIVNLILVESGFTTDISSITPVETDVWVDIYNKLDLKLNISDIDSELDINSNDPVQNRIVTGAINDKADVVHSHSIIDLTDFPSLANVAMSGDYSDLSNKPTIISLGGDVTFEKQQSPDTGYLATYVLKQGGVPVGDKLQIPKDYLLKSVEIKECLVDDEPVPGYKVGDFYFDFVFNTKEGSGAETHQYLLANVLKEVYTADNSTLELINNQFKVKNGGITTTQLASSIVTSLGYADAYNQSAAKNISASDLVYWNGKQDVSNLVTSFGSTLSDSKYPSEKLVKEYVDSCIGNIEEDMLE